LPTFCTVLSTPSYVGRRASAVSEGPAREPTTSRDGTRSTGSGLSHAKRQPALPDSNDLAPLLSRKNHSRRDILGTLRAPENHRLLVVRDHSSTPAVSNNALMSKPKVNTRGWRPKERGYFKDICSQSPRSSRLSISLRIVEPAVAEPRDPSLTETYTRDNS